MRRMSRKHPISLSAGIDRGFTIVELLVTLVIVGILASAALPMTELARQRMKEQDLRLALRDLRMAIDAYKSASDSGHIARKAGESGYPHSLDELVSGVIDIKDPSGGTLRFLRRIPLDPFAEPGALPAQTWGKRCYASDHTDPREGPDIYDVYSRSEAVGFNGIPYKDW